MTKALTPTPTLVPRIDPSKLPVFYDFSAVKYVADGQFQDSKLDLNYQNKNVLQTEGCDTPGLVSYYTTPNTKLVNTPAVGDGNLYFGYAQLDRATCKFEILYVMPVTLKGERYYSIRFATVSSIDLTKKRLYLSTPGLFTMITDKTVYITYDGSAIKAGDFVQYGMIQKVGKADGKVQTYVEVLWMLRYDYRDLVQSAAGLK